VKIKDKLLNTKFMRYFHNKVMSFFIYAQISEYFQTYPSQTTRIVKLYFFSQ